MNNIINIKIIDMKYARKNNIVFNNLRHYDNLIKDYISKKSSNEFIEFEILDDSTKPPTISIPYEDFFQGELNDIPYLKFHDYFDYEGESVVYIGLPVDTQHYEFEKDSSTFEVEAKMWIVILSEKKLIQIGVFRRRNKTTSSDWEYEFYFERRGDDNFEEEYNFMKAMVMPLIVCYGNMLYVKFPMTTVRGVDYYLDSMSGDYDYGSESYYWGQHGDAVSSLPVPVGGTDTFVTLSNNINGKSGYIEQILHRDTRYEYALNLHFVTNATDDTGTYEMLPKEIYDRWYEETVKWWESNERDFGVSGNYNRILYCDTFDDNKSHMSYDNNVPILGDDSFNDIYSRVDWANMCNFTKQTINAGNSRFEFCLLMFVNDNGGLGKMLKAFDYMYYKWNELPYNPQWVEGREPYYKGNIMYFSRVGFNFSTYMILAMSCMFIGINAEAREIMDGHILNFLGLPHGLVNVNSINEFMPDYMELCRSYSYMIELIKNGQYR